MNKNTHITPINVIFMLIAIAPYIGFKFGYLPIVVMAPFLVVLIYKSYKFYEESSQTQNISYI